MNDDLATLKKTLVDILRRILETPDRRQQLATEYENLVHDSDDPDLPEVHRDLAFDLAFYTRDASLCREDSSYFGDDELVRRVRSALEVLKEPNNREMKIGKIISVENGPKRNVEVRIARDELYSDISSPSGVIAGKDVTAFNVVEEHAGEQTLVRLYLKTVQGKTVLFYTAETPFDVALLLDELEAALGDKPRTWKKTDRGTVISCDAGASGSIDGGENTVND